MRLQGAKRLQAELKYMHKQTGEGMMPQISDITTVGDNLSKWQFKVKAFDTDCQGTVKPRQRVHFITGIPRCPVRLLAPKTFLPMQRALCSQYISIIGRIPGSRGCTGYRFMSAQHYLMSDHPKSHHLPVGGPPLTDDDSKRSYI